MGVGLFFLLSGFGNTASLLKIDKNLKITWLLKRNFRLLVSFILSFILVFLILKLTNLCDYTAKETLVQFLHLSLPYTGAWYFKIQLLFYLFIFVSFLLANALPQNEAKKRIFINTLLFTLVLVYALFAKYLLELPDYWWKNSVCFSLGCFLYYERTFINKILQNKRTFVTGLLLIFLAFAITYLYAVKYYTSIFCLICFPVISFALCFIMNELNVFNGIFTKIGNISLELYLLHIGLLKIIDMKILPISGDTELIANIAVFLILSFVLAFMTNRVNSKIFQTFTK